MNLKRTLKRFIENFNKLVFINRKKKLEKNQIRSVLIISLFFRGDFLFQTPFIQLLSKLLPNTKIDIWTKSRNLELTFNNPHINEVILFDNFKTSNYSDNSKLDVKGKYDFIKKIRDKKYDLVIDLTGMISTAVFAYFSKAKYTIGINNYGFGAAYNKFVDIKAHNTPGHLMDKYLKVLKNGFELNEETWEKLTSGFSVKPYLYPSEDDKSKVTRILKDLNINNGNNLIIIHTTAGWKAKEWEPLKYSSLINKLTENGINFIFVGDENDRNNFNYILRNSKLTGQPKFEEHFLKLEFLQLAELIDRSDVLIGSDSAPLHIAGAMDTPSIGLFGPTNPEFSNPIGEKHKVIYHKLFCSATDNMQYCTRNAGMTCPTIDCMKMISVDEVLEETNNLIKKFGKRS